jgi:hypothetical protein
MKSKFLGIGDLLPIYEDLEDGAVILWHYYGVISAKHSDKIVRTKKEQMSGLKLKQK